MTIATEEEETIPTTKDWNSIGVEDGANVLYSHVLVDHGAYLYFSVHQHIRSRCCNAIYIYENLNKDDVMASIEKQYYPALIRDFLKWETSNGRKVKDARVFKNHEVRAAT